MLLRFRFKGSAVHQYHVRFGAAVRCRSRPTIRSHRKVEVKWDHQLRACVSPTPTSFQLPFLTTHVAQSDASHLLKRPLLSPRIWWRPGEAWTDFVGERL